MISFIGLDNRKYKLDANESKYPLRPEQGCKSKIQYQCGQVLKTKFPLTPILEEVPVPGHNLIFDFFLPTYRIVCEIDGQQHNKYVPFFHKSKRNFLEAQKRDSSKETLCEINNWTFIRVSNSKELEQKLND